MIVLYLLWKANIKSVIWVYQIEVVRVIVENYIKVFFPAIFSHDFRFA